MKMLVLVSLFVFVGLSHAETVIVKNVTVHRSDNSAEPKVQDVIVVGDRILEIGVGLEVSDATEIIDGQGLHMTAGLFSAMGQLGLDEIDLEATTIDSRLDDTSVGPAFDVQYGFNPLGVAVRNMLVEGVMYGVMSPRVGPDPLAGYGAFTNYANGQIERSRIAMFGAVGAAISVKVGGSRAEVFGRLRRNLTALRSFRSRGYEPGLSEYSRVEMQALMELVDKGKPLVMQAHRAADIRQLLSLAQDFDLNLVISGGAEAWQLAGELATQSVPVILDPLQNLPLSFEQLGARLDNAALLHAAGVKLAIITTDLHNTRLLRQHAGNAVAHGLTWEVGISAITRVPAEIFGLDQVALLEPGAKADFVLWSGDPLEVTTYARRIMSSGQWVDLESRQTRLFERYRDLENVEPHGFKYR